MTSEDQIKTLVEAVIAKIVQDKNGAAPAAVSSAPVQQETEPDGELLVPNPHNRDAYASFMKSTSARIGVWRAGTRRFDKDDVEVPGRPCRSPRCGFEFCR